MKKIIFSLLLFGIIIGCSGKKENIVDSGNITNPPDPPIIFNIIATGNEPNRGMLVGISGGFEGVDEFEIQRTISGGSFSTIKTINKNSYYWNDQNSLYNDWEDIDVSTYYSYRVRATNKDGISEWSNTRARKSIDYQTEFLYGNLIADAYTSMSRRDDNYGSLKYFDVSAKDPFHLLSGEFERGLVKFDLPTIPTYGNFDSAELCLCQAGGPNANYPKSMRVFAALITKYWDENSVTFNTSPGVWIGTHSSSEHNLNPPIDMCVYINVSSSVSKLYQGIYVNHGFMISTDTDSSFCAYYTKEGYLNGAAELSISYNW